MRPRPRDARLFAVVAALAALPPGGSAMADVEPARDPFADNACIQCHRDLPGRSSEIVAVEWRGSVHYAAGVGCEQCHGGNARVRRDQFASDDEWKRAAHLERDPQLMFRYRTEEPFVSTARGRSVSYFCGKCHADIKEKHLGSPHGAFGDPTCLYCHGGGSHAITEPTLDIIDTRGRAEGGRCSPCHLASSMKTVGRIKEMLEQTEDRIREGDESYQELEGWGYRNLELQRKHKDARQVRSHLRQVFHSFDMLEINNYVSEIQLTFDRVKATHDVLVQLRAAQRRQATIGGLMTLMLLLFAGLLVYYRHSFLAPVHRAAGAP